jgi:protein SCO1/2
MPRRPAGTTRAGPPSSRRLLLGAIGAAVAAALLAVAVARFDLLPGARIGGDFALVDHEGRRVRDADFRGSAMLVFFGFTHCPDVCPTALARIAELLDALGPEAGAVRALFISVDPRRDTPALLRDYVAHFSPRIVGLTGSETEIAAAARAYRAYYRIAGDPRTNPDYLVDHSSFVYVMDRTGRFVGSFNPDAPVETGLRLVRRAL